MAWSGWVADHSRTTTVQPTLNEPPPQAFITALELPCLSTSFETFRHVRDRLLALQHHLSLYPMAPEHQRRVGCLNTLLYLRGA